MSVLKDEDLSVDRGTNRLLSWKERGTVVFCHRATLCREQTVEEKPSDIRTLQTRGRPVYFWFQALCASLMTWVNPLLLSWELPWPGAVSAVTRRAGSKTRCAPPWQRSCLWRKCESSCTLLSNGKCLVHEGPWPIKGPWLSLHCSAGALSGLNSNAKGLLGQTQTWSSSVTWREIPSTSYIFQQAYGMTPPHPWHPMFAPATCSLLFLYLHCTTCIREENSLGFFLEVSLLRIDGICNSLTFASHLHGWLQDSACSWSIWRKQSRSGASWPEARQKCVNRWVPAGWECGESLVSKRRSGFMFRKHIPTSSVMHTKYNVPENRCYRSIEDCSIHHHWNHDYALQKSNCHLHPNEQPHGKIT